MRHRRKASCPSCLQAHRVLKLQPMGTTNRPSPVFAIAKNPEQFSDVQLKFHFSTADVAYKRTPLLLTNSVDGALQSPMIARLRTA